MNRTTPNTSRRKGERGATVVEFAVIAALLLIVVFGILEAAFIFYQRHFIENAAREGLRIGVRADNFNCFDGFPSTGCTASLDRKHVVEQEVTDYLTKNPDGSAGIYKLEDTQVNAERVDAEKALKVTVTVNNFFPRLLSGLVPGFVNPDHITYSASGSYEDPSEYDNEE